MNDQVNIVIDGIRYVKEEDQKPTGYVVIRSRDAGVFCGYLVSESEDSSVVELKQSRRIYYWDGAATLSQLALEGVKNVKNCKFPAALPTHKIIGVCEIIPATEAARLSIASVPVWSV